MPYDKQTWEDFPSTATPITAARLTFMETGIDDAHTLVDALVAAKKLIIGEITPTTEGVNGDFYLKTTTYDLYGPKTSGSWGTPVSLIGPEGPQGATGNSVRSGPTAPSVGTGVDGDFYIDYVAGNVYGPKAAGAWGPPTSLGGPEGPQGPAGPTGATGAPGQDGQDGATFLSGAGAPTGGVGNNGDFYLDNVAGQLYGPKYSGAWGSPTNLKGPQGDQGIQGPQGIQGIQGVDGADGLSAYEVAVAEGFIGTEADWLDSLIGADGAQGDTGPQGPAGAAGKTIINGTGAPTGGTGTDGDFYINTTTNQIYGPKDSGAWGPPVSMIGPQGPQGTQGIQGVPGNDGSDGADGAAGPAGADGKTIRNGSGAPAGGLGVDGDFYVDTSANTIYGPKASGSWGSPTSLVGPQGPEGPQGPAGAAGGTQLTTKGDLLGYSTTNVRIPVSGNNGYVLTEDSTQAAGVKWAAATGGGGSATADDASLIIATHVFG